MTTEFAPISRHALAPDQGLIHVPEFLPPERQADILARVDSAPWNNDLARRTQQYGWRYDYRAKAITPDMYLGRLPDFLQELAEDIREFVRHPDTGERLFTLVPEQCIVNEYVGSQGIAEHTDHPGFGPAIATVSLVEEWPLAFAPRYRGQTLDVPLETGSCLTMTGPSRSRWTHQIRREQRPRNARRVSLTFRTVLNRDGKND